MKTHKNLYKKLCLIENLILAWQKARKGKTKKKYVQEFEEHLEQNLHQLRHELITQTYQPLPLEEFSIKDPKTRKIAKSDFRDRIIHHALVNILEPIFYPLFIYDSYANQKGKGTLLASQRLTKFIRQVSCNGLNHKNVFGDSNYVHGFCLKADIKHYFQEVDHDILLTILERKISDKKILQLVQKILTNPCRRERERETPDRLLKEGVIGSSFAVASFSSKSESKKNISYRACLLAISLANSLLTSTSMNSIIS